MVASSGELKVPSTLPDILKCYTKAAIRTQPYDLLLWSLAYFKALVDERCPPMKERLECSVSDSTNHLTPEVLRLFNKQFREVNKVTWDEAAHLCQVFGVPQTVLKAAWDAIFNEGSDSDERPWDECLSQLAKRSSKTVMGALQSIMGAIADDSVTQKVRCDLVLYHYNNIQTENKQFIPSVTDYLSDVADYQKGFLIPNDLSRPSCPPLE